MIPLCSGEGRICPRPLMPTNAKAFLYADQT